MIDLIFKYDDEQKCFDIDLDNPVGNSLYSKICMLLFTDAKCEQYELPKHEKSCRGFWCDSLDKINTGSKLWLLERAKKTSNILNDVNSYCYQALEILLLDGLITDLKVNSYFVKNELIIKILINTSQGEEDFTFNFGERWHTQNPHLKNSLNQ